MLRTLLYCFAAVVVAAPASAQLTAAEDAPVAMGHHHLNVTDIEAHRVLWGPLLGGELVKLGPIEGFKFPNVLVFLREKQPTSGSVGTAVNHIGFLVKDIKGSIAKLKAGGIEVITRQAVAGATEDIIFNERTGVYMAYIQAPDQLKVELIEDRSLSTPIANHHIHYYTADVEGLQAWYAKVFGAVPGTRGPFKTTDLPGVNLTYSKAKKPEKPIQGTVLDHTGFEIKNLKAFCERLEKMGIVFDRPYQEIPSLKLNIAFLTDPAGAYLELTEGLDKL